MKTLFITIARCCLLLPLFLSIQPASGFYDPTVQRWVNRDPLDEPGFEAVLRLEPVAGDQGPNIYAFVCNNPIGLVDAFGLASIEAQVGVAIMKADVAALQILAGSGALTVQQAARVAAALSKYNQTALQYIGKHCKGSISSKFPSQFYYNTLAQIKNMKDADGKRAWKLLNDSRFQK